MNAQQIAALGEITKQAIADAVAPLVQRVEQVEKQSQLLAEHYQQETAKILQHVAYDDTEIKQAMQSLRESIPAPYDDDPIKQQVADVEKRICAKQSRDTEALLDASATLQRAFQPHTTIQRYVSRSKTSPKACPMRMTTLRCVKQ